MFDKEAFASFDSLTKLKTIAFKQYCISISMSMSLKKTKKHKRTKKSKNFIFLVSLRELLLRSNVIISS